MVRPFDRTAGDEVQAVFDAPDHVASLAAELAASGEWSVGIGVGAVDTPLPAETRAGAGEAFVFARTAVEDAKKNRWHLTIAGESASCVHAQTAGRLLVDVLTDRSDAGREAVALVADGTSQADAAERLGISPQAISLRLRHARWDIEPSAVRLFAAALDAADHHTGASGARP
ncbi:sigma-70 region 4 domain-containing protein [Gordonia hydrophobica]|uniref:Sigma-70 region 4 domain-containing protein n=1 Tax=Gordonia hydrophobica TaxID=40516 RepID=A0ABZ2U296_9ACTN|nr:sigma-70 region 4 domain-containing protein [Gordonia hydrophobica]MBM7369173.1 hypothetical protein [Gordonia hydrophobica]